MVLKCRHKTTGQIVAIKKFKESDDDEQVKKTALREIKVLKALKHENIVSLLEVFRVKGKLYLVFEFVEKTILEEIEKNPEGLEPSAIKRLMWQLVRAIHFCHQHNIIHRDIKPENLLVSRNGVLKLCDFGFARPLAGAGAKYTEYVSTRWYRAPELLVGDVSYGKAVDVWSIGCMFAEITTGLPLFPGDSDIDQLYHIIKCLGHITARQQELFRKNSLYVGVKLPHATEVESLRSRFPQLDKTSIDFLHQTIQDEPLDRWTCAELLKHPFFENLGDVFEAELQDAIARDLNDSAAVRKKRNRKPPPSRGGVGASGTSSSFLSGSGSLPSPTMSIKSTASYDDYTSALEPPAKNAVLKPTFKPMVAATALSPANGIVPKDKLSVSPHVILSTGAGVNGGSKKFLSGTGAAGTGTALTASSSNSGHGTGGGYHLPTLQGAVATPTSSNATATNASGNGDTSPYSYTKRPFVPAIAENQPILSGGNSGALGVAVPAEHMEFIHQHASVRQSMTSHGGGRSTNGGAANGLVYPYSFGSSSLASGAPPKPPPPSSYMRNPYLATQAPTTHAHHKRAANPLKTGAVSRQSGVMDSSSDSIYSPKKHSNGNGSSNGGHGKKTAAGANGMGMATDVTPHGIYVPPRTSHSTLRGAERTKHRREHDSGRSF